MKRRAQAVIAAGLSLALAMGGTPLTALAATTTAEEAQLSAQAESRATLTFSDDGIAEASAGSGYKIEGTTLTITEAGTYTVTGSCSDGSIEVKKGVTDVTLVLRDLTLAKSGDKAVKFKAGASGSIVLEGTNTLSTSGDKAVIKANAETDDSGNVVYASDGTTTGGDLTISGSGTLNLSSSYSEVVDGETEGCDAINCEGDLTVLAGTLNIDVTDDALHADNTLTIGASGAAGPTINVEGAEEGFEGATVNLVSGQGSVTTDDDGVNAANSDLTSYGWQYAINVSGGTWKIVSGGDGLDSNGDLTVSGGVTEVYGTGSGNGALDIGEGMEGEVRGTFSITGGTLFAVGSDMCVTPSTGSYALFGGQGAMGGPGGQGGPGGMGGGQGGRGGMAPMSDSSDDAVADAGTDVTTQAGGSGIVVSGQNTTVTSGDATLYQTTAAAGGSYLLFSTDGLSAGDSLTLASGGSSSTATVASGATQGGQPSQGGQPGQGEQPNQGAPGGQTPQPDQDADQQTQTSAMSRLYNPYTGEHFYTASTYERDELVKLGWQYEGVGWTAPATSDTPVFRLYNPYAGDHHYTTSEEERDYLVSAGWNDEGIGWYSDDAQTTPLYREYNPNAVTGAHNYTTSAAEHDYLVSIGWSDEGIAWYAL